MAPSMNITFSNLSSSDVEAALAIEQEGYPADEAGSLEAFRFRQSQAGDLFLGAYVNNNDTRQLLGYVCSTLSPVETLTHESMSTHVPNAPSVCVHSVCVSAAHRKHGIGLRLLKEYVSRLQDAQKAGQPYKRVLLITHEELRSFYEKAGFEWLGLSNVVHGAKPWYDMRLSLTDESTQGEPSPSSPPTQIDGQHIPLGIWEELQRRTGDRPTIRLISDFHHGITDLISPSPREQGLSMNKFDLLCPRDGCGSIILKSGTGSWVERASVQLDIQDNPFFPALPTPPETAQWWLVTPSPMIFENIGFSRPVAPQISSGPRLKLLICVECDLGPLGWCEEDGSEFWLACSRVGYRG